MRGRSGAWLLWPAALVTFGLIAEARGLFPGLRFAINRHPADMPSTRAISAADRVAGYPLLSVAVDSDDLYDAGRGLIVNPSRRGREWERFAYASYFDNGQLRLASGAGIRVHGGRSRVVSEKKSFALFFRRRYGDATIPAALFFPPLSVPLGRLVLHNDLRFDRAGRRWQFVNPLAYEIATRIGAVAPRTKPVRFFLNGQEQGVYVVTEHISESFFEARFGHGDFEFEWTETSSLLKDWARHTNPFTAAVAAGVIDLENLTYWAISILFCGTTDIWQGTIARDRRRDDAKWFWVNWDMDHSFMDLYQRAKVPWEINTFRTLLGAPDARSLVLGRLLSGDREYRDFFFRTLAMVLNHRLTPEFLDARLTHYRVLAASYGIQEAGFFDILQRYFAGRPAVVRALVQQHLRAGALFDARVSIPGGAALDVDGYRVTGSYSGKYFSGSPLTLSVPVDQQPAFSGWIVNGRLLDSREPRLSIPVSGPLEVTARFSGPATSSDSPERPRQAADPIAR